MGKFEIVNVDTGETVQNSKGAPIRFVDAQSAQEEAKYRHRCFGNRYKIRAVVDSNVNWREREAERFKSGVYILPPWHKTRWVKKAKECVDHFVHVSTGDPSLLAYTSTPERGIADKQTPISPSKYLHRYYSTIISEKTLRKWLAVYKREYGSNYELKFAYTGDEIVEVYKFCSSCMTGSTNVRAYEGPDLAVAYIELPPKVVNGNSCKRITARAVVWPKKKLYHTMYGDADLLEGELQAQGYQYTDCFKGARLKRIKHSGYRYTDYKSGYGLVLPSIDCAHNGLDYMGDKKYVIIK